MQSFQIATLLSKQSHLSQNIFNMTYARKILATFSLSLALAGKTQAFSPSGMNLHRTATKLNSYAIDSEDDAMQIMMKAEACAHSDVCSIDDAEKYLQEVIHIQSDCVSGSLNSAAICDDVLLATEVVSSLREKISQGNRSIKGLNPLVIALGAGYLAAGAYTQSHNPAVDAFTLQEWYWGVRDGYAGEMMSSFVRHGGLPAIDSVPVTPFTPEEWWWSIRDGYLGEMISQSAKNGGLAMSSETPVQTAFLPEEWNMAMRDGYLSDMISHYFKHGGL